MPTCWPRIPATSPCIPIFTRVASRKLLHESRRQRPPKPAGSRSSSRYRQESTRRAADQLKKLLEAHPHQFPLAYLAASQAAHGWRERPGHQATAASGGDGVEWQSLSEERPAFRLVRDEPSFKSSNCSLDDSIREMQPPHGFDARLTWTPNGVAVPANSSWASTICSVPCWASRAEQGRRLPKR